MSSRIIIYGGGGHAKVVLDSLQQSGLNADGVIDTKYQGDLLGVERLSELPTDRADFSIVIAIGDNVLRKNISEQLRVPYLNVIHPTAIISKHSEVGTGCMILHDTIVQAGSRIGDHVIVNTRAQVDHDCVVGSFVHLAPGSVLCGGISVGEGTLIGAGAVVKPGVKIGSWATVGAGAVIVKDVPDHAIVVGNPGRIVKITQK